MKSKVLLIALLFGFLTPVRAAERVAIRVSPAVAFAPANLLVRATVDVSKDNRSLEIIAESADFYRSSEVALDGDHAPRVTPMQFKSLPSGAYQVSAVVRGASGVELASTHTSVNIVGGPDL
jgi:hypothetical protein